MKIAKFGKERFPPGTYQKLVGDNAKEFLHKNSKELVEVLRRNNKIKKKSNPLRNGKTAK